MRTVSLEPLLLVLSVFLLLGQFPTALADVRSDFFNMGYRGAFAVAIAMIVIAFGLKGRGPLAKLLVRRETDTRNASGRP